MNHINDPCRVDAPQIKHLNKKIIFFLNLVNKKCKKKYINYILVL